MKAEFSPRIDLSNRTQLEKVIPLRTPLVVFVDPSDACNFKCRFCPTSDRQLMKTVGRPWDQLPFELFKKIAHDMCDFPDRIEVLRLYKDGEPLMNKHLAEMIQFAKEIKAANRIDTTTNASLLTPKRGKELVEAGLDRINISVYGVSSENYKNFSQTKVPFERVLENVRSFYEYRGSCEMLVKVNGDSLTDAEKEDFLELFGDYTDKIFIEHTMACWPEFELAGVDVNPEKGIYGQELADQTVCPYPFYSISLNSDGVASVCFLDWSRKLVVGDCQSQSLKQIWNGKSLRSYQKMFLDGLRRNHPVCGDCGQMTHGMPDDLDPFAEDLMLKLQDIGYFDGVDDLQFAHETDTPVKLSQKPLFD